MAEKLENENITKKVKVTDHRGAGVEDFCSISIWVLLNNSNLNCDCVSPCFSLFLFLNLFVFSPLLCCRSEVAVLRFATSFSTVNE